MLRLARFALNPQGNETGLEGYTTGRDWNGWACPLFTKEQADEVVTYLAPEMAIRYDAERDAYLYTPADYAFDGTDEEYPARVVDGVKVYEIGDGWCWEEI